MASVLFRVDNHPSDRCTSRCRQLERLSLSGCSHLLRPTFFQLVGNISSNIKSIDLSQCSTVCDVSVKVRKISSNLQTYPEFSSTQISCSNSSRNLLHLSSESPEVASPAAVSVSGELLGHNRRCFCAQQSDTAAVNRLRVQSEHCRSPSFCHVGRNFQMTFWTFLSRVIGTRSPNTRLFWRVWMFLLARTSRVLEFAT